MKFDEIEFFNTAEIRDGVLYRFPLSVCDKLSIGEYDKNGQFIRDFNGHRESARTSYGIELRFETAAKNITLLIETARPTCVTVYNGDFQNTSLTTGQGRNEIKLSYPEILEGVGKESENRFGKNVWRIALDGEGDIRFRGLLTERGEKVSVPQSSECPEIKLLAYGSSITQGCGALCPQLNYLNTVAQILGIDIQNKAIAGGCFCERETVEYLCRETFDAVYLEPGTNIANRPLAIIEERVGTLIDTFCERFADKKIFIMTPVRGLSDVSKTTEDYTEYYSRSRGVIVSHAQRYANAILLDGHKLLDKAYYLSGDILHPSGFGHVMMGTNFAKMLKPYMEQIKREK